MSVEDASSSDEEDQVASRPTPGRQTGPDVEGDNDLETEQRNNGSAKDRDGHSSSDEVTLAEPQSPDVRMNSPSVTSVSPQSILSPGLQVLLSPEPRSHPATPNLPYSPSIPSPLPKTPMVAILPSGKSLKIQVPSKPVKSSHGHGHSISNSRGVEGSNDGHETSLHPHTNVSSKGKGREKVKRASLSYNTVESQPSRIVRAFIATKSR
jgi:hypothetical protein